MKSESNKSFELMIKETAIPLAILTSLWSIGQENPQYKETLQLSIVETGQVSNGCDGNIHIDVLNKSGNFEYSVDAGATFSSSPDFSSLCLGRHFVHVRNVSGDFGVGMIHLRQKPQTLEVVDINTLMQKRSSLIEESLEMAQVREQLAHQGVYEKAEVSELNGVSSFYTTHQYRMDKLGQISARLLESNPDLQSIEIVDSPNGQICHFVLKNEWSSTDSSNQFFKFFNYEGFKNGGQ